jgi:hypothetical protein
LLRHTCNAPRRREKNAAPEGERRRGAKGLVRAWRQEHATHEPLIRSIMAEEVRLAGLSFGAAAILIGLGDGRRGFRLRLGHGHGPIAAGRSL